MTTSTHRLIQSAFVLLLVLSAAGDSLGQKLTAEDVVNKHLESLGSAEARASVKSRVVQGTVVGTIRVGGAGQSKGGAVMASQGRMTLLGLIFGVQDYSNEKIAFDGEQLTVGEWQPGKRTRLGGFLMTHDIMIKEGLMGGTLSSAWPLSDLSSRNPKLRYSGLKKVEGRQVHALDYQPRSGGNLEIRLFFDAETYQHVRTEYQHEISAAAVSRPEDAAKQRPTRLKLTEEFADYRKEGLLILPHAYKIRLVFESDANPAMQDWELTLSQFLFNKDLPASQFRVTSE